MADTIRYVVLRRTGGERFHGMDGGGTGAGIEDRDLAIEAGDVAVSSIADLARDPDVIAGAPAMPVRLIRPTVSSAAAGPADGVSWGVEAVGANASKFDGSGVKVAVLDTGIDRNHPAFAGMKLLEEDFTGEGKGDGHGHGTHCAGTIFGRDVGGRIGVARGIGEALIGKVLDSGGGGTSEMVLRALRWAQARGANIVSMSLGFSPSDLAEALVADGWPQAAALSQALQVFGQNLRLFDALMAATRAERATGREMLVIAATGNVSERSVDLRFRVGASLPSAAQDVMSVGALGQTPGGLAIADFSNTFPTLSAPGVGIRSAWPGGGMESLDGTSMAAPHVAGVAALWWQALETRASAEMVRSKLVAETQVAGLAAGYDHTDVGYGLVCAP